MVIDVIYTASSGTAYHLQTGGIRIKDGNFHKWTYKPIGTKYQQTVRVQRLRREAAEYEATLFFGGPISTRKTTIEQIHEDWEADIRNTTPGRITWGNYYIDCFIISSDTHPDKGGWYTADEIVIYAPYPFWIKEQIVTHEGWAIPTYFTPESPRDCNYKLVVHGPMPSLYQRVYITVDGAEEWYRSHYMIDFGGELQEDEQYIVDTRDRSFVKVDTQGIVSNIFSRIHTPDTSILTHFPMSPIGCDEIGIQAEAQVDLTLYTERSEPKWM